MPVETKDVIDAAEKVAALVADHPALAKYKAAQKAVADDTEARSLLSDFDRMMEALMRQEQQGMPISDAQQMQIQSLQQRIASHIKIKALNIAQTDFVGLLAKVGDTIRKPLSGAEGGAQAAAPAPASRLVM